VCVEENNSPPSQILTRVLAIDDDVRCLRKVTEEVAEASTVLLVNNLLAIPFEPNFVKQALREHRVLLQATSYKSNMLPITLPLDRCHNAQLSPFTRG